MIRFWSEAVRSRIEVEVQCDCGLECNPLAGKVPLTPGQDLYMSTIAPATQETPLLLRPVIDRLVAGFQPEQIWLFGSRAEGRDHAESDWDLLMVLPDGTPPEFLELSTAWSAVSDLGLAIDVVPCTQSEFEEERTEIDTLPRAAFERGWLLYVRAR